MDLRRVRELAHDRDHYGLIDLRSNESLDPLITDYIDNYFKSEGFLFQHKETYSSIVKGLVPLKAQLPEVVKPFWRTIHSFEHVDFRSQNLDAESYFEVDLKHCIKGSYDFEILMFMYDVIDDIKELGLCFYEPGFFGGDLGGEWYVSQGGPMNSYLDYLLELNPYSEAVLRRLSISKDLREIEFLREVGFNV